jgi:hypothetical protein
MGLRAAWAGPSLADFVVFGFVGGFVDFHGFFEVTQRSLA